jgi:hypothetical protein
VCSAYYQLSLVVTSYNLLAGGGGELLRDYASCSLHLEEVESWYVV